MPDLTKLLSSQVTPGDDAAKVLLREWVRRTRRCLKRVVKRPGNDPEDVHQLRVATRRLAICLSMFKSCIPGAQHRAMKKASKGLRQASAEARDADVLRDYLERHIESGHNSRNEVSGLQKELKGRQKRAYKVLKQQIEKPADRFAKAAKALSRNIQKRGRSQSPAPSVGNLTAEALAKRLSNFLAAANGDLEDLEQLHALRISGKRLRYTVEIAKAWQSCDIADDLVDRLEAMQTQLGEINDLRNLITAAEALLTGKPEPAAPGQHGDSLATAVERWRSEMSDAMIHFLQAFDAEDLNVIHLSVRRMMADTGHVGVVPEVAPGKPRGHEPIEAGGALRS